MAESNAHARNEESNSSVDQSVPEPTVVFSRDAVRNVDKHAIEKYGLPGIVLMENAARALHTQAMLMLEYATNDPPKVLVIAGGGNNGGDGYALARHLHNSEVNVIIAGLSSPDDSSDAGVNRMVCQNMSIEQVKSEDLDSHADADLIVDAIFGTGLSRDVEGDPKRVIEWINTTNIPVLAVDVPSGMNCDTGKPLGVCVRASRTVTFVGTKPGFLNLDAQPLLGEIIVGDIGVAGELLEHFGMTIEIDQHEDRTSVKVESPRPRR